MSTPPLITAAELRNRLAGPENFPVVLDVRWSGPGATDGRAVFERGHIQGARFVDLDTVLAEPDAGGRGGRHPLPSPERFEAGMRAAGVSSTVPVVIYDDNKSIAAARAWWLLRHHGHDDVRVLDGGWGAWKTAGLPVAMGAVDGLEVGNFEVQAPRLSMIDAEEAAIVPQTGVLLDGRPANRYRGEGETVDPVAGHIPGAASMPAVELVSKDGTFLPAPELARRFEAAGVRPGVEAAAYCGSGVQACHVALAAAVAGITDDLAVYAGSWSDWITDPDRPVATG